MATRIQSGSVNSTSASITTPTTGDLILVFAYNGSAATAPSLPAGYTNVDNAAGSTQGFRCGYKISAGSETDTGTWTNATQVDYIVYRGARAIGTGFLNTVGNSATLSYGGITMQVTDGTSLVAGFAGAKGATAGMNGNTTSLTNRANVTTSNALDSSSGKTSFSTETLGVTGSGRWVTFVVEIRTALVLTAGQGSYTLSGQAATLLRGKVPLAAAQGSYTLTGQAVTLTYASAGPQPTLVQHLATAMERFDCGTFNIGLPNDSLAGNLLVLCIQFADAESISSITDNKGNTWTAGPTTTNTTSHRTIALYYVANAPAGTRSIVVTFTANNATALQPQATVSEFYNVATSSPGDGSSSANNSKSAGDITTTVNGDLIFQFGADLSDTTSTGGAFNGTSITKGTGFTLLNADLQVGVVAQYQIQSSSGTINPAFTTSGSATWGTVAMAFKAASAGTAPGAGIRIVHLQHILLSSVNVQGRSTRIVMQFPSTGNLIVGVWNAGTGVPTITNVTDSASNTYNFPAWTRVQNPAGNGVTHIFWAANATTSTDLSSLTVTGSAAGSGDEMLLLYDVAGADTQPFDKAESANGTQNTNANVATVALTPLTPNSLIICGTVWDRHTANGVTAPASAIFDSIWNDFDDNDSGGGGTTPSTLDMDHGYAHVYNGKSLAALTFTFSYNPFKSSNAGVGGWGACAVAFTPSGSPGCQSASDNFNGPDEAPLSNFNKWTCTTNNIKRASNTSQPNGTSSDRVAIFNAWNGGDDYYVEMEITVVGSSAGTGYGICARHNPSISTDTYYRLVVNGSGGFELGKIVTGSFTSLRTGSVTYAAGKKLGLWVKGSTLKIYYDGVQQGSNVTDSAIASGLPGIAYSSTATSASGDNWFVQTIGRVTLETLVYALTGNAVALIRGRSIAVAQGSYALSGQAVTLTKSGGAKVLTVVQGAYTLTGQTVGLLRSRIMAIAQGTYTLTGQAVALLKGKTIAIAQGAYALTGQAVGLLRGKLIAITQALYTLSGQVVSFLRGKAIAITQGSYVVTGQTVSFPRTRIMSVAQGSYVLTGQALNLLLGKKIPISQGGYALTGQPLNLAHGFKSSLVQGAYSLTGSSLGLLVGHKLSLAQGAYALTGEAINFVYSQIGHFTLLVNAGSYALTGSSVNLLSGHKMPISQGAYALGGQAINLFRGKTIFPENGIYVLTGEALGLLLARKIGIVQGSYALTGQTITLARPRSIALSTGAYSIAGSDLNFNLTFGLQIPTGSYVITGQSVNFIHAGGLTDHILTFSGVTDRIALQFSDVTKNVSIIIEQI